MTNEKACIASKNMSLDILRIIAALMVLMVHVGQWTGLNKCTDVVELKGFHYFLF